MPCHKPPKTNTKHTVARGKGTVSEGEANYHTSNYLKDTGETQERVEGYREIRLKSTEKLILGRKIKGTMTCLKHKSKIHFHKKRSLTFTHSPPEVRN